MRWWWSRVATCVVSVAAIVGTGPAATAHTHWVDGTPVPDWVRNACCDPGETHHLMPQQVHRAPGGYRVDGVRGLVPTSKTLPSQDGDYWIFYRDYDDGTQYVFCLFAPPDGA